MTNGTITALMLLAVAGSAHAPSWAAPSVMTTGGPVIGASAGGVSIFKGIPFAAPPTGPLRWKPPQPVATWTEPLAATAFGADCMQEPIATDAAPMGTTPAEDCLYLNVWTPAVGTKTLKPVVVWIFGGGLMNGGASPPTYSLDSFARSGVVGVSFNYRVGRFGYFAHPALLAEAGADPTVNFGHLDAIAALRWVQANIARFGGDPKRVTIMGESAGGGQVVTMLTSPLTRESGLFSRAIMQSAGLPNGRWDQLPLRSLDSAQAISLDYARSLGIEGTDAAALAKLRALPAAEVVKGVNLITGVLTMLAGVGPKGITGPVLDGQLYAETPEASLAAGRFARVPVLVGANDLETGQSFDRDKDALFAQFGPAEAAARAAYDPDGTATLAALAQPVYADRSMVEPARFLARRYLATGVPAFHFRFGYVAEHERGRVPGAGHASEIPYVMNTIALRYGEKTTPADRAAAAQTHATWVRFIKGEAPVPGWRPDASAGRILFIGNDGAGVIDDPWAARLDATAAAVDAGQRTPNPRTTADGLPPEMLKLIGGIAK